MKRIKLLFCALAFVGLTNATVYYVDPNGTGVGGTSWATAFKTLAAAYTGTTAGTSSGQHEVWVKQGTYTIAASLAWRTGINYYGGFTGTETLRSQRSTDASLTILDGGGTIRPIATGSLTYATVWDGFTIQNGYNTGGAGGAILQRNATLQNCIVQNCRTTNYGGGGIAIGGNTSETDSIKVLNCIIRNNTMTDNTTNKRGGGGIQIKAGSFCGVVRSCVIESNTVDGLAGSGNIGGGGVHMFDGKIENCIIRNNTVTNKASGTGVISYTGKCQGGGILVSPGTTTNSIVVKGCTITGNAAVTSSGGGICIDPLSTSATIVLPVTVSKSIIANNSAYAAGGGIMADGQFVSSTANYTIENCVLANNESSVVDFGGGAAYVNNIAGYVGAVIFRNCSVTNNKTTLASNGGAGIFYNNIPSDITNCVFWGNSGVTTGTPYHVRVKTTLTTNKLLNCAFDSRFVESEVSPSGFAADLTGKVIVDLANTGSTPATLYANFVNPTNFVGKIVTASDQTSFDAANWAITASSACLNAGTTLAAVTTDITNLARPQGGIGTYDIGAYELQYYNTTVTFSGNGAVNAYTSGTVVSQAKGTQLTFDIVPNSGFYVSSVLFNGVDVKSELVGNTYTSPTLTANSTLAVEFTQVTGTENVKNKFQCYASQRAIQVRGLRAGDELTIFGISGTKIQNLKADNSDLSVTVQPGIYLVKANGKVQKIIVR